MGGSQGIIFSLFALGGLGRNDLRGEFCQKQNSNPLKYNALTLTDGS